MSGWQRGLIRVVWCGSRLADGWLAGLPRGQRTAASLWKGRPSHCGGYGVGACEGSRLEGETGHLAFVRAACACGWGRRRTTDGLLRQLAAVLVAAASFVVGVLNAWGAEC